jgi:hypothetical protein
VSRPAEFALQLAATSASALLDYLVGRLTSAPSLGIACWAALILLTAAALEFFKDLARGRNSTGSSYPGRPTVVDFIRPVSRYQWSTVVRALWAAGFAGAASHTSEILLPCGIALVSIANAMLIGLPQRTLAAIPAGFRSQIAYSLSIPDGWLFRLPVAGILWGCAIPFVVGVIACGIVSGFVRA